MFEIVKNRALAPQTTFKIGPAAEFFAVIKSRANLLAAISWAKKNKQPIFVLGHGSNVLISRKIKGLVLKNEIRGLAVLEKKDDYALVEAKSGESWTRFVDFAVGRGLYGLENLFLIYGTVGAAPVQNIGAYGVELKDVFYHLKAIDLKTGHEKIFSRRDCRFGYRDSVFKGRLRGRYFIYALTVKLKRRPDFNLSYGPLRDKLAKANVKAPTARDIIRAITEIRNSKLPNPALLPNAGSFFKNATVGRTQFWRLRRKYPDLPSWPAGEGKIKIPAAWLIEAAGFKGKRFGPVSMYKKQALVLVNHGRAEAKHVLALAKKVKAAVKKKFAIDLEEEVNVI